MTTEAWDGELVPVASTTSGAQVSLWRISYGGNSRWAVEVTVNWRQWCLGFGWDPERQDSYIMRNVRVIVGPVVFAIWKPS